MAAGGVLVSGPACRQCGHERGGHPSFVPGGGKPGYCGSCGCYQYKPERPWAQLLTWYRKPPAPVPADVVRARPVPYPAPGWAEDDDDWTQFGFRAAPYVEAPRRRGGAR